MNATVGYRIEVLFWAIPPNESFVAAATAIQRLSDDADTKEEAEDGNHGHRTRDTKLQSQSGGHRYSGRNGPHRSHSSSDPDPHGTHGTEKPVDHDRTVLAPPDQDSQDAASHISLIITYLAMFEASVDQQSGYTPEFVIRASYAQSEPHAR